MRELAGVGTAAIAARGILTALEEADDTARRARGDGEVAA